MFRIKDDKIETENKIIRFPLPLINKIEKKIKGKNVSFSRFIIQGCEYALENMKTESKKNENKYAMKSPKMSMECYHCGHTWKVDTRTFFKNSIFITQCTKCKEELKIDSNSDNSLLYLP